MDNNVEKLCCGNCKYFMMINNFGIVGKCEADNYELMYHWETCDIHKEKENLEE